MIIKIDDHWKFWKIRGPIQNNIDKLRTIIGVRMMD